MIQTLTAAVLSFIATEIDDFLVAVIIFSQYTKKTERASIITGKYIGLAVLAGGSAFLAIFLSRFPHQYIGFLGLVPFALGIKSCFEKNEDDPADKSNTDVKQEDDSEYESNIAAATAQTRTTAVKKGAALILFSISITIGSGGDNIGVYIPLFASMNGAAKLITLIVYAFMQAAWCTLQIMTAAILPVKKIISRTSRILVPAAFILLGLWILSMNGTIHWLYGLIKA
jgi:cadmium resistance protein CadD (predicted permease)